MGNMIGILSTVILVSTLATLIFAVGAYVIARRRRELTSSPETDELAAPAAEPRAPLQPIEPVAPPPVAEESDPPEAPPWRGPRPAPTSAPQPEKPAPTPAAEPGANGPLFRKLTLPGEPSKTGGKKTADPHEEREQTNWE